MLSGVKRTLWNLVESSSIFVLYLFNKKNMGKRRINWVCMETNTEKALIPRGGSKLFQELSLIFFRSHCYCHRVCSTGCVQMPTTLSAPVRSQRCPTASAFGLCVSSCGLRLVAYAQDIRICRPRTQAFVLQNNMLVQNVKSKPEIRTVWKEYFLLSRRKKKKKSVL